MERNLKTCGVCGLEKVIWKAKTRDHPQMCKYCWQQCQPKKSILDPAIGFIKNIQLSVLKQSKQKYDKSIHELLKLATIIFNKWIRKRDALGGTYFRCISCNELKMVDYADCGHYIPSTYSYLKFNEDNCHAECQFCNRSDKDHLIGYRFNLINKVGKKKVEWLESHKIANTHKWDKQELLHIISKYK